jgi:Trypsin-co-occurring domain 1
MAGMTARTIPMRVGDVELLVETVAAAGSEPTSRATEAADGVVDAFSRAQQAIVEVAASTATMIAEAGRRGTHPDHFEVEFGLKISAKGNVIVASASGEATLKVTLTYDSGSSG